MRALFLFVCAGVGLVCLCRLWGRLKARRRRCGLSGWRRRCGSL